jgi:hypothetical protein
MRLYLFQISRLTRFATNYKFLDEFPFPVVFPGPFLRENPNEIAKLRNTGD